MDYFEIFQKELEERKNVFGNQHPCVAETLNVMGIMNHYIKGNQEKALRYHQDALEILLTQKQQSEDVLIEVATTLADIGNCYSKLGEWMKAYEMYFKAIDAFNNCKISNLHPKKRIFQQSINNRLAHVHLIFAHSLSANANKHKYKEQTSFSTTYSSADSVLIRQKKLTRTRSFHSSAEVARLSCQ